MNRTISFITKMMFAAVTVIMAACSSDDNATQALTVQVKVSMPEGFKSDILYTGHTVTMGKYTAITNEKGIATFEGVIPDLYDISTSCEITAEEYEEMTGNDPQNENYVISGSLLKYTVGSNFKQVFLPNNQLLSAKFTMQEPKTTIIKIIWQESTLSSLITRTKLLI